MDERERAERHRERAEVGPPPELASSVKKSANTTGTSSCRDEVAGSASETYEPP